MLATGGVSGEEGVAGVVCQLLVLDQVVVEDDKLAVDLVDRVFELPQLVFDLLLRLLRQGVVLWD